jgi:homoserine kinase
MGGDDGPIIVPATSANLGCGFDCAALALSLYMKVRGRLGPEPGFRCRYSGPHGERIPTDDSNLVARAARLAADRARADVRGGEIEIENEIPVAAGLGSSAAAIVAGILLAARHLGKQPDAEEVVGLASEIEGHPDNVAAACHGGLVVAAQVENGRVRVARTALPENLDLIAVVPDVELPTERARAVLPASYSRQDAIHNLQRLALLVATCFSGEYRLEPELFRDRVHQPFRAPLVPGLGACFEMWHPDLLGVFLSGAGSSVLAIARGSGDEIGERLAAEFRRHGVDSRVLRLKPENRGALILFSNGSGLDARLGMR